jgi:hypothetical protein
MPRENKRKVGAQSSQPSQKSLGHDTHPETTSKSQNTETLQNLQNSDNRNPVSSQLDRRPTYGPGYPFSLIPPYMGASPTYIPNGDPTTTNPIRMIPAFPPLYSNEQD